MRTIGPAFWTIALLLPLVSIDVQADLRCKNDLARPGDSKASVVMKCGEPVAKESFCKPVQQSTTVQGTDNTILRFESGVLKSMKYGDRVP